MRARFKCFFGHKWDGCRCTRCGETRDEGHNFNPCTGRCARCHKTRPQEHSWNGCTCTRCGKKRDEEHDFIPLEEEGFAAHGAPVREQCTICKRVRFLPFQGSWERNPLKTILDWPENFSYAPNPSVPKIEILFPGDSYSAKPCIEALHASSVEPDISVEDFVMLSLGTKKHLGDQMHSLFKYFAHTHNPKLTVEHLEAFAEANALDISILKECHTVLTSKRTYEPSIHKDIRKGKAPEKEDLTQLMTKLPQKVGDNLLHLLAVKRDVYYQMWREVYSGDDDYIGKLRIESFTSVRFYEAPQLATEMLKKRDSPKYRQSAYDAFPKRS